ncbi:MAG: hypothetical protein [Phage AS32]|nr:MAG: hypothetical protein [Phage AS32]
MLLTPPTPPRPKTSFAADTSNDRLVIAVLVKMLGGAVTISDSELLAIKDSTLSAEHVRGPRNYLVIKIEE